MSKADKLFEVYAAIDTSSEIAHATLEEVMENLDNERMSYILLGVMQQLENIKKAVDDFNLTMQGGAA